MAEQLVSVQVISNNRCIVPWSVVTVDPSSSFDDLLKSLKAGKYSIVSQNEFLSRAIMSSVSVGKDKQSMSVVGENMNVCDVCRSFGSYERHELEQLLSDISYTCGAKMEDLQLPELLKCVEIRIHQCCDRIERLYYSAYPSDVLCIHCGSTENIVETEESIYPYCSDCSNKDKIYKRGAAQKILCMYFCLYYCMYHYSVYACVCVINY